MAEGEGGGEGNQVPGRAQVPGGEGKAPQAGNATQSTHQTPGGDDATKSELEKLKEELRKLAADRDKWKQTVKTREDEEKAKNGEFQELYQKEKSEADALRARVAAIDAANAERLKEAETRLSKEDRAEYDAFISKLPVDDRLAWADKKIRGHQNAPIPPNSPGAQSRPAGPPTVPGRMTPQELADLKKADPAAYFAYLKNT